MSHRKTLARLAAAPLLMVALAAPPALAVADTPYTDAERASNDRFQTNAEAAEQGRREIVDAYRADAANQRSALQDRRSENTVDPSRAAHPRMWPAYPRALPPAENPAPVPTAVADDDGDDWLVPVLAFGGTLLLGAGLATGRIRGRRVSPA
jgi:hypothetical protein